LDTGDISSPLQDLLNAQVKINILLSISILLGIILLFKKLFKNSGYSPVSMLLSRILPKNFVESNIGQIFNKFTGVLSQKYFYFIFIILTLNIIFLLFLNYSISWELSENLDEYIRIHNDINKSLLLGCISSVNNKGLLNRKISYPHILALSERQEGASQQLKRISYAPFSAAAEDVGSNNDVGNIKGAKQGKVKLSRKNINKVYEYVKKNEQELDLKLKTTTFKGEESFVNLISEKASDISFMHGYNLVSSFPNVNFINEEENLPSGMQISILGEK